jgi:hypothetical protein
MRVIVKQALLDVVKFWHKTYLPKHFQPGAMQRYGYRKRKYKYLERKKRAVGHMQPLVYTGLTEKQAKRFIWPRGTAKGARGVMYLPNYIYMVPKLRDAPALGRELTATAACEHDPLEVHFRKTVDRGLERVRQRKVVKV